MISEILAKLRKFGLAYDDFPTMMENVDFLLRILTIDIYHSNERTCWIFYILTFINALNYIYVVIVSMAWCVFFRYGRADLTSAAVVLAFSSCSCTSISRFIFMKLCSKQIKNTVEKVLKCDSQVVPNTRFAKNLRKRLRVVKRRVSIIWIFLVANSAMYIIVPLFISGRHLPVDLYLLYGLEPMTESPNYEIAIFIITTATSFGVYTLAGVVVYTLVIVGYNEAQMHALSDELRNIWNDSQNFYNLIKHRISDKRQAEYIKQEITNKFIRFRLLQIVKFHIININLLHELDHEFRPMFAVEYTVKAFSIIVGLLGGLEKTYLALPYTTAQVIMDCLAGQRLIEACDDFENSLYSCQWENFNKSDQRTVLLMLMMSQKTLVLTVGGVATLDYKFMMTILRSAYSTYATLKTVMK